MIRLVRSVRTNDPRPAAEIAAEIAKRVKDKHSQKDIRIFVDRFTDDGRNLHWHIDFDDLAHFERWQTELAGDETYTGLLARAQKSGAFDPSSMRDSVQHDVEGALKLALH